MSRAIAILVLGYLGAVATPTFAQEAPVRVASVEGVTEYRLPNGLRILLMPDASKPLIHVHCVVLVGSRHECYGEAGMAHLLEHMLIKGTAKHPDIMKMLRDRGATNVNAYTMQDTTRFVQTLPASDENLEFVIRLEADRLVNSVVKRDELLTEMTVVRNEFEQNENSPPTLLVERMAHAAFRWHNYGKALLGNRSDIERVPVDSLQAFYKKHYRPDNALLVVTGRFDAEKALALATKHFGPIPKPSGELPSTYTQEPPQDGERNVTLRRAGTIGAVGAAYHIPAASHPDFAAVMVLGQCLTSQPEGRLYKALVTSKKTLGVGGGATESHDPGLMQFVAGVGDPTGIDAARDALIDTLESLADSPITDVEVERSRKSFTSFYEASLTDAGAMAHRLDFYAGVGDWRLFFWGRDQVEKVTAKDVNRVAAKYLVRNNRTVGVYYPGKSAERVDIPESTDLAKRLDGYLGRKDATAAATFDATPESIEKRVVRGNLGAIKTAFLTKPTRGEVVELHLTLRYGNEDAMLDRTAALRLMPAMLLYGSKTRTRQQLIDELDRLKAGIISNGSPGMLTLRVIAKKAHLAETLTLVREVLREPTFPADEFATQKTAVLANYAAQKAEPGPRVYSAVVRKLKNYPKTDIRYEPTHDELIAQTKAVTVDDVKAAYVDFLGAQAGELAVVGDFDPKDVIAGLEPALVGWKSKIDYRRIEGSARPVERGEIIRIVTPDKANAVYFAALSFALNDRDPDYPALVVGTYLLGGHSILSRLGTQIRKNKGLSYGVEADFAADALDKSALFTVAATTNPGNMVKVRAMIAQELKSFLDDGVTPAELDAAKKAYAAELKTSLTNDVAVAGRLGTGLYLGRTFNDWAKQLKQLDAVTPADVQRAFRRVVDPAKLVIAEAGDFGKEESPGEGVGEVNKHLPMKLSHEEACFLRHWMYDEMHYLDGSETAKQLQREHRAISANLAEIIAAAIPDLAEQWAAGVGPPPAEPPTWPWSDASIAVRLAEARALLESGTAASVP